MTGAKTFKNAFIIHTANNNTGALATVRRILSAFSSSLEEIKITVVDTSSINYKRRFGLKLLLKIESDSVIYIDHNAHGKSTALNKALLTSKSDYVSFRNDVDIIDEQHTLSLIKRLGDEKLVCASYSEAERPKFSHSFPLRLESVIFQRDVLNELLPFPSTEYGDLQLLERALSLYECQCFCSSLLLSGSDSGNTSYAA
ncbi:glycosyltransferase [Alteromonas oceanisediminis]|uniref:glycosyltransferase n=1 Tax=Alteromonas oceanisediminis TaxID=2836180 RepID=UPI001BDA2A0F|nr:glycosyltransferase [Alteromonas oceanisediminis]MBT0587569.1 glycosyltransferase [Alteromonas oceanisediminis]